MNRLIAIQQELKAPKNQKNNFGGYNYRSCEDILEAVKPLLAKHKLALVIEDDIVAIDGRFYVKANACLLDDTGHLLTHATAFAREEESKKGMDASQLTGSTSSYARKYALNGLFAIDDTKDADATNTHDKIFEKKQKIVINPDLDLIEGLKACSSYSELSAYYKNNYQNVYDKEAFNKLATKLKAKYSEVNNDKNNN